MKTYSVIVLSKNNGRTLGYTLLSILKAKDPPNMAKEIIVVDARSTDNTSRILRMFSKWIKVVYDKGKGIGIARNIGVMRSHGNIVCFVDADAVVSQDHFLKVIEKIKEGFHVVDVQGIPPLNILKTWHSVPMLDHYVRFYGYYMRRAKDKSKSHEKKYFANGCFISFKREVFLNIKGFWHYPPFGADDTDFSFRAIKKGYKIGTVKIVGSYPIPRQSIKELMKEQFLWGKGFAYFIAKFRRDQELIMIYRISIFKNPILSIPLRLLVELIMSLKLALLLRRFSIIPFWTVRRGSYLLGFLLFLRRAMKHFSKK
mgnify:CR=1 FL=1